MNLLNFEKNRASILNYINKNKEYSDLLIYISKVLPNLKEDNIELKINNIGTVNMTYIEKYNCSMFSLIIKDRIVEYHGFLCDVAEMISEKIKISFIQRFSLNDYFPIVRSL